MNHKLLLPALAAAALLACQGCTTNAHAQAPKIKVLIVDGQNNHAWARTTPYLRAIYEEAGIFTVDVSTAPPAKPTRPQGPRNNATPQQLAKYQEDLKAYTNAVASYTNSAALWAKWRPHFSDFDVIVSNYNGEDWPEEVRAAFEAFVKNGGGFVSYHAADNSFSKWNEYNQMIALGGWGGRNQQSGPYLRLVDGKWTPVQQPGEGGNHGPQRKFLIESFAPEHPIMKGLPPKWLHTQDELYQHLRGPATNVDVLGASLSELTHEEEPMLMAITYGKGRIFHTTLGHDVPALEGLGFQVTLARGTQWAATGKVTLPAPKPGELSETTPAEHKLNVKTVAQ